MRSERKKGGLGLATALALSVVAAALLPARPALAYCRTASCKPNFTGQRCVPAQLSDCDLETSKPLFWQTPCVTYSLQEDASALVDFATVKQTMKAAFAKWQAASCADGTPRILVTEGAPASCTKHEYNQTHGNANLIVFRDGSWPYEGSSNTLALTTVTYNLDTGEIYDADMELNSADNNLTTSDTQVEFDLLSILTHETGHYLGLAHSESADATMYPAYQPGNLELRTLSDDDIAGICAIYPPGAPIPVTCDATPRHGFSALCGADQLDLPAGSGCACQLGSESLPLGAAGFATTIAALGLAIRRRSRRARSGGGGPFCR